jgi:hypothetical protein
MANQQGEGPSNMNRIRWLVPVLGLSALALAAVGYRYAPAVYFHVLTIVMLHPYRVPFIDAQQIPAVIDCWKHGVDVFVSAPCDPLHRVLAYSPLFLRATFLPKTWSNWMGLALDAAFFMSLALLPPPRRPIGLIIVILATFSSMPVFALERANMDVVMFLLIVCAGWCCVRSFPVRLVGYGLITLAGLLKFYPLVLFILFLRERMAYFVALCAVAFVLLTAFLWHFQGELREMVKNLPLIPIFSVGFGYRELPFGLGRALQWLLKDAGVQNAFLLQGVRGAAFIVGVFCLLVLAAVTVALKLSWNTNFRSAFAALTPPERGFLVIGSTLICGCFFASENDGYRGIHFLFVLPGLLALSAAQASHSMRAVFRGTVVAVMLALWGLTILRIVAVLSGGSTDPFGGSAAIYICWIIRELTWWWIVSVLLAVLFCFIAQSTVWRTILDALRRPKSLRRNSIEPSIATRA